jgi:hypothetical protein
LLLKQKKWLNTLKLGLSKVCDFEGECVYVCVSVK